MSPIKVISLVLLNTTAGFTSMAFAFGVVKLAMLGWFFNVGFGQLFVSAFFAVNFVVCSVYLYNFLSSKIKEMK